MRTSRKPFLLSLAGALAVAVLAGTAQAQTRLAGDLNNDGQVTVTDVTILSSCAAGTCVPASATLCGGVGLGNAFPSPNPNAIRCGDAFGDHDTGPSAISNDLGTLVEFVAQLPVQYTPPGATIGTIRTGCPTNAADPLPTCSGTCSGGLNNGAACTDATDCPTVDASGTITSSEIWPKNCRVRLTGTVLVDTLNPDDPSAPATVLTIEEGSTVVGDTAAVGSVPAIIVLPGARLVAQGTQAEPILFTSNNAPRAANDWGGVMLNGRSTVNRPNCLNNAEGLSEAYGGCISDDNSGIVTYVRVEFAGRLFTPDNELNNFTMNAVGANSQIHHVQAHFGADDCIEWFGGTVNNHHMVASACGDDGFDWQLGFTGSLQYGLMIQNLANFSAGNNQSRGIEADNSEFGFEDLPRSAPGMCNLTLVGTGAMNSTMIGADRGILFRRGTAGKLANLIVANWNREGVNLNDSSTSNQACNAGPTLGNLTLSSSIFFSNGSGTTTHASGSPGGNCATTSAWYGLQSNMGNANGSNANNPQVSTTFPAAGQLYSTTRPGASAFTPTSGVCPSIRDFFDDTTYAGAFDPAAACNVATGPCDWLTKPWVSFDL